jgi:excisionase family DNA binding protein
MIAAPMAAVPGGGTAAKGNLRHAGQQHRSGLPDGVGCRHPIALPNNESDRGNVGERRDARSHDGLRQGGLRSAWVREGGESMSQGRLALWATTTCDPAGETTSPVLLTVIEAARLLRIGRSKAYELIVGGELETVHIGRCIRVPYDAVLAYVAALRSKRLGPTPTHSLRTLKASEGSTGGQQ